MSNKSSQQIWLENRRTEANASRDTSLFVFSSSEMLHALDLIAELEFALSSTSARNADLEAGYSSSTHRELASESRASAAEATIERIRAHRMQLGSSLIGEPDEYERALADYDAERKWRNHE